MGMIQAFKMICRMSISKYAVAQPSKHFQEPVTVTQAHAHTVTHRCAECRVDTPQNWVRLDALCHSVFLDPVMLCFSFKWQIRIVVCAENLAKWLLFFFFFSALWSCECRKAGEVVVQLSLSSPWRRLEP